MRPILGILVLGELFISASLPVSAVAQATAAPSFVRTTAPTDPVIQKIMDEGTRNSQAMSLAQVLTDSIGPRLVNSDRYNAGQEWLLAKYASWGIAARKEAWGSWNSWQRGITHLDLVSPRVRSLEAMMLAWSPGTKGKAVEADVMLLPADRTPATVTAWMPTVKGKFVLIGAPNPTCRTQAQLQEFGQPGQWSSDSAARLQQAAAYRARVPRNPRDSTDAYYQYEWPRLAGVAGIISTNFSAYSGVDKIFGSWRQQVPTIGVTCEDYNLLYRLAQNRQSPKVRLTADSRFLGEKPVFNVIAEIKGSERPNEYIVLSAHYDSWDGGSGATDNGTGTITMMEALRILKSVYPNPRRTILVGHWGGEEQGLNGSRSFVEDHPDIVNNVYFGWNQDNGTGRVVSISPGPFTDATARLAAYLNAMPSDVTHWITLGMNGPPATGGSDNASFQCARSPVVSLGALPWDYGNLTWHTNRDTYDKIVPNDLRNNAILTAMLTYMADRDTAAPPRTVISSTRNPQTGRDTTVTFSCPKSARNTAASTR